MKLSITSELVEQRIFLMRGQRVMIDRDLAELYGVETKYLNRQVKRNDERFPPEFMFQLSKEEKNELVTNWHRFSTMKHSANLPYAFTEHGVAMLASVLNSKQAIIMSIHIIKVFVRLREIISTHKDLAAQIERLERKLEGRLDGHEKEIHVLFEAIRQLMNPPTLQEKRLVIKSGKVNSRFSRND